MKHFLLTWISTAVALLITAQILHNNGFVVHGFSGALVAAIIIGLVNAFIRPFLALLAFPITLITFGLFTFVINAVTLLLASALTPGYDFQVKGFVPALLGSIVLAIVSSIINYFVQAIE
jgi:putative membrane protein